jgi:hypothetical protein
MNNLTQNGTMHTMIGEQEPVTKDKQQTAVDSYIIRRDIIEIEARLGKISADEYEKELTKAEQQAKEMEKEQMIDFAVEYTYGTKRVGASLKEDFIKLYEQTYGGGEQ